MQITSKTAKSADAVKTFMQSGKIIAAWWATKHFRRVNRMSEAYHFAIELEDHNVLYIPPEIKEQIENNVKAAGLSIFVWVDTPETADLTTRRYHEF